jgi:NAD+ synthase
MRKVVDDITGWLRERVERANARGLVLGLSGGIDSAVVAGLCQRASPGHVVGVIMPCHSDPLDEADARLAANHFGINLAKIDLAPAYDLLMRALSDAVGGLPSALERLHPDDIRARVPAANVKPRLRMASLYFVANSLNYLVVGTGNRSEIVIGYYTKYGDGGVDLLPIGDLLKSDVRAVARELGVPTPIIDKPPSAGLWAGQTDENEMGFTYEELERFVVNGRGAVGREAVERIEHLARVSEHKRSMPPTPGIRTP